MEKKMTATEITPERFRCGIGACPSVFKTDRGTYVIIGKISEDVLSNESIKMKIGKDEFAVELPIEIINNLFKE